MSNTYALLIAVDFYFPNRIDGRSYNSLGGCVRDVSHVEAFLKHKLEVPDDQILKLTASAGGAEPSEPPAQWPTYQNMVAALVRIGEMAQPGDQVYIHYSGHGGRTTTWFPERKGENAYDEALVPTDIGRADGQYLRDVELFTCLNQMVAQDLRVSAVLDCCNAGGMTRGPVDAAVRGLGVVDTRPQPQESLVAPRDELARQLVPRTRNVTLGSGWLPEPEGYVLLAACRPSESAYEAVFEGDERNGALTYWLLDSLQDLGPGLTYKMLHDRILPKVHSQFEQQTPQLQGEGDRVVFGGEEVRGVYAVPVMEVDKAEGRLRLNAGQAQGLRRGAQFAIYPRGTTDYTDTVARQAVGEITELGAVDSWATVAEAQDVQTIEQGAQAVLVGAGSVKLVRRVSLVEQDELSAQIEQESALQAVAAALEGNGWVEVAQPNTQPDYQVTFDAQGQYELWDGSGHAIANLRPALAIDAPSAAADVAHRLVHLARYHATVQLDNRDPLSPLAGKLEVELAGKQTDYDPADPPDPQPFTDPGRTPALQPGEWAFLRICNAADRVLNVTVLDLQPDWGIAQIYPTGVGDNFVALDPAQEVLLPLQAWLPETYDQGTDVLKVFATVGTTNFRWLELPALDQPLRRSAAVQDRSPSNPLEALLSAVTADQPPTRNLAPATYPSREWTTTQVELCVQRTT